MRFASAELSMDPPAETRATRDAMEAIVAVNFISGRLACV